MSLTLEKVQCDQVQAKTLWHDNGTLYSLSSIMQGSSCMYIQTAGSFDWMLCFSIITSLGSSALCFVYFDMNDHRFARDRLHQAELAALFCYRTAELSAHITLLALFAVRQDHLNSLS